MDEGFKVPREERLRLNQQGYRELCRIVDERDNYRCIICGSSFGLHHHHVRFRSAWGSDREDNLVCLCFKCHDIYAHGRKEKAYRDSFLEYLQRPDIVEWRKANKDRLEKIYTHVKRKRTTGSKKG